MEHIGVIFDIKQFAVHDGPGIRQTVFFKGCPLRCQWCHNPEGMEQCPQLMFSRSSCTHCGRCTAVCPQPQGPCTACGLCVEVCPLGLRQIVGREVSVSQLEQELQKDSAYYAKLGGGITFSGGEPLMQGEFLLALLDRISGLHTAIETSGFCPPALFAQIIRHLSFVMMDIKLIDPALHRKYTGVDNAPILENLAQLCHADVPFVVRIPMIPGVNDTRGNLEATARLLSHARHLQKVELLPYHKTAGAKYSMLGRSYTPQFDTDAHPFLGTEIFEKYNIRSTVL